MAPTLSQKDREALATKVNLLEAKANVARISAARMDLEGQVATLELQRARLEEELEKNAQAQTKGEKAVADFEAKLATYDPITLKA